MGTAEHAGAGAPSQRVAAGLQLDWPPHSRQSRGADGHTTPVWHVRGGAFVGHLARTPRIPSAVSTLWLGRSSWRLLHHQNCSIGAATGSAHKSMQVHTKAPHTAHHAVDIQCIHVGTCGSALPAAACACRYMRIMPRLLAVAHACASYSGRLL